MRRRARSAPSAESGSLSRWSTPAPRLMIACKLWKSGEQAVRRHPDAGVCDVVRVADRVRPDAQRASLGVRVAARPAIRRPADHRQRPEWRSSRGDLSQAMPVEREPLQPQDGRAVMQLAAGKRRRARGRSAREAGACPPAHALRRHAPAPSRHRQRRGRRTCARPTSQPTASASKIGTSVCGTTPISSWHSRRAASATSSPRSTRPGRQLDQIAVPERQMRAKPELADQHDLRRDRDRPARSPPRGRSAPRRAQSPRRPARRDSVRSDRMPPPRSSGPLSATSTAASQTRSRMRPSRGLSAADQRAVARRSFDIEGGGEQRAGVGGLRRFEQLRRGPGSPPPCPPSSP